MLLSMAVYDTIENRRTGMTARTLESMKQTVNFAKHILMVADNGSVPETHALYKQYANIIAHVEYIGENIGTARALNLLWQRFDTHDRAVCKIDNDVEWHQRDWADLMEEVFERDPDIGICGLKRKDLEERPDHPNSWFRSKLRMLPHKPGERWLVVEECNHIMGTCQAYSRALFERIGYLYQPSTYGFDDSLASLRAHLAGFQTVFLLGPEIDHIDPGGTEFIEWKKRHAGEWFPEYERIKAEYKEGTRPLYYDGGFE